MAAAMANVVNVPEDADLISLFLDAVEDMILFSRGRLQGDDFATFCRADPRFGHFLRQMGGPKSFAQQHPNRFAWRSHAPGGSLILATERQRELFALLPHVSQEKVRRSGADQDLSDILESILISLGGSLAAGDMHMHMRGYRPHACNLHMDTIGHPVMLKAFILDHPTKFQWTDVHGAGQGIVALQPEHALDVATRCVWQVVLCSEGFVPEADLLRRLNPTHLPLVRKQVETFGGVRGFAESMPQYFRWCPQTNAPSGAGDSGIAMPEWVMDDSIKEKSEHAAVMILREALTDILERNGGFLQAAEVPRHMSLQGAWHASNLLQARVREGGLKKFVETQADHFEWFEGCLSSIVRLARPLPPKREHHEHL